MIGRILCTSSSWFSGWPSHYPNYDHSSPQWWEDFLKCILNVAGNQATWNLYCWKDGTSWTKSILIQYHLTLSIILTRIKESIKMKPRRWHKNHTIVWLLKNYLVYPAIFINGRLRTRDTNCPGPGHKARGGTQSRKPSLLTPSPVLLLLLLNFYP